MLQSRGTTASLHAYSEPSNNSKEMPPDETCVAMGSSKSTSTSDASDGLTESSAGTAETTKWIVDKIMQVRVSVASGTDDHTEDRGGSSLSRNWLVRWKKVATDDAAVASTHSPSNGRSDNHGHFDQTLDIDGDGTQCAWVDEAQLIVASPSALAKALGTVLDTWQEALPRKINAMRSRMERRYSRRRTRRHSNNYCPYWRRYSRKRIRRHSNNCCPYYESEDWRYD